MAPRGPRGGGLPAPCHLGWAVVMPLGQLSPPCVPQHSDHSCLGRRCPERPRVTASNLSACRPRMDQKLLIKFPLFLWGVRRGRKVGLQSGEAPAQDRDQRQPWGGGAGQSCGRAEGGRLQRETMTCLRNSTNMLLLVRVSKQL